MKAVTLIVALALVSMVYGTCHVAVTPVARAGSTWPVNNGAGIAGIYDIAAHNTGTQTANRVHFTIVLPNGVQIIQWWQFSRLPPTYEDLPDNFVAGSTYANAGFVVEKQNGTSFPSVTLLYNSTDC